MVGPGHSKHSEKIGFKYFLNHQAETKLKDLGSADALQGDLKRASKEYEQAGVTLAKWQETEKKMSMTATAGPGLNCECGLMYRLPLRVVAGTH